MTGPLPSLALEMSMEGIALHQLAFDGHWHELSRVGLNDAALREKMANMREIAQRLEGRRFKVRVWLPADQIIKKSAKLTDASPRARDAEARQLLEKITPHGRADFAIALNPSAENDQTLVAGARIKTMQEAAAFAKSHGFRAEAYSTRQAVDGFADKPYFRLPPNRIRQAGVAIGVLVVAGALIIGGATFRMADPYLWWEKPPEIADFGPFQNPDPSVDQSADNVLPAALDTPEFPVFSAVSTQSIREPLPYLPQRRLDATALDTISEPAALYAENFDVAFSQMAEATRFSLPLVLAGLSPPATADRAPALGLYNVLSDMAALVLPTEAPASHQTSLPPDLTMVTVANPPDTVASILFMLEPLPAIATTIPYNLQRELANTFGIITSDFSVPEATVLAESKVVDVTRGLPEILPRLRSGRAIPPQVAVQEIQPIVTIIETIPADPETIAAAARGFRIIEGPPEILPVRRVVPPVVPEPTVEPTAEPPADTADSLAQDTVASLEINDAPPPVFTGEIEIISGQPALLPLLRSGATIPEPGSEPVVIPTPQDTEPEETQDAVVLATNQTTPADLVDETDNVEPLDPAIAAANALRAARRPQAIIDMPAPVNPMLSDAAPALARLPNHRGEGFNANAARIAEIASNRPRAVAPVVPTDPQTVNLPTTASVARAATIENGINLNKTSLMGIFGTADNRDVLIRLASGRILEVGLGDRFSGWTVVAIGSDSIRIQKGNRTEILRMPN